MDTGEGTSPETPAPNTSAAEPLADATGAERRANPRAEARLPARLSLPGAVADAAVQDISLSGIRCHTDQLLKVMTQVGLVLMLPVAAGEERPLHCQGAVVRSRPLAGDDGDLFDTAIFFTSMSDSDRQQLDDFVQLLQRAKGPAE